MLKQEVLKSLFESILENNSYNVNFKVDLFNSDDIKYYDIDEDGKKSRFVPTMIPDIIGNYINIPNTNSFTADGSIEFDIMVDYEETYGDIDTNEIQYVLYQNTLNAIEEFRQSLVAQYFPLGTPYLFMGGEDSTFVIDNTVTAISNRSIYLKFIPYNTDNENILVGTTATAFERPVTKNSTHIRFEYTSGNFIELPYTVNEEIEIIIYHNGTNWKMVDKNGNEVEPASPVSYSVNNITSYEFGKTTGFEGLVKRVAITSSQITSFDFENVDFELSDFLIDVYDFQNKNVVVNSGQGTIDSSTSLINNCILWSEDGNAIFGFNTLNPISNIRLTDGGFMYQAFDLPFSVFISNDLLFGNNFEYYLDGVQIYPVDRQHTMATELNSVQKYGVNYNTGLVEETAREHTMSFYYIPTKQLTKLLKHVVTGDISQNTTYQLVVQYPFFKSTYNVVLDSGGTEPNINTLSTFTLTFKRKQE
jgi:hypothetical protein